jgi:PAS domain S-box-containing protein
MVTPDRPQILIVDDRPENLTAMEALLSDLGFGLVRALSGNDALRLSLKHNFALVLLDVQMPDMDGFETAEFLRANPKTRNLPIIFVTAGMKGMNYQFKGYDIGAVDYLTKPLEAPVLRSKVKVFCELHSQRLELERREASLEYLVRQRTDELIKTAESLLESRERYRSAFEQTGIGIAHIAKDGEILQANPFYCSMLGYEPGELNGRNLKEITHSTVHEKDSDHIVKMLAGELCIFTTEEPCQRKNGTQAWFRVTTTLARDENNQPEYFIRVSEDITENRMLKEQILQSQKMEAVGLLAGGIAHDFNNILSVIMGYASMMNMKLPKGDAVHGYLENLTTAAERAAGLTRGLLAFSRKQEMSLQPAELNELVTQTSRLLKRVINEDIILEFKPCQSKIMANVDSGQIEQVLMNLVTNARDAMSYGGRISITLEDAEIDDAFIKTHGFGEPGRFAVISVSDTGAGISPEAMQRIFDPFFTTKEIGKGTGLGLSIVYGIIRQHKGYVNACSEPAIGTTFRVFLPVLEGTAAVQEVVIPASPRGGSETILLAEDDEAIRVMETQILNDYGYKVITARDGRDAVTLFQQHHEEIDLVLLDGIMPRLNGNQAYQEMRLINPDIKAIFITGYTPDLIENKGISMPGVEILMKPVPPQELARKVRQALDM